MRRATWIVGVLLLAGCVSADREPLRKLPEGMPYSYEDMLSRARQQATGATAAFYVDDWAEVENAAIVLEQTSRLLPKTLEIPDAMRAMVETESKLIQAEAQRLGELAKLKDVKGTQDTLQRINLKIRELRVVRIAAPAPVEKK